jgi:hypothetical protein
VVPRGERLRVSPAAVAGHAVFLTYLEEGRDAFYVQALGRDPH